MRNLLRILLKGLIVAAIVVGATAFGGLGPRNPALFILIWLAVLLPMMRVVRVLFAYIDTRVLPAQPVEIPDDFILWLRPFREDRRAVESDSFHSLESAVSRRLSRIAPVVCLCKPGDRTYRPRTIRVSAESSDWQATAAELIERARFLVIVPGTSGSMRWELAHALSRRAPQDVLLFWPFRIGESKARRDALYRPKREAIAEWLPTLPESLGNALVVTFDTDGGARKWAPQRRPLGFPNPIKSVWNTVLRERFEGYRASRTDRVLARIAHWAVPLQVLALIALSYGLVVLIALPVFAVIGLWVFLTD